MVAGPLALLFYLERRPELFLPDADIKVIAVVRSGATVTLAVPEAERERISLLYDSGGPRINRLFRLSDGTSSVRFIDCASDTEYPGRQTQFNGGFFVRDAHCAAIEVWVEGRTDPIRRWLPFDIRPPVLRVEDVDPYSTTAKPGCSSRHRRPAARRRSSRARHPLWTRTAAHGVR